MKEVWKLISLFLLSIGTVDAFVFSCEQVKYKIELINSKLDTDFICVIVEIKEFAPFNFSNFEQLDQIYVQNDDIFLSLANISGRIHGCVKRETSQPWRLTSTVDSLDCTEEFTLIASSTANPIIS
ncbi:hypothetical protein PMAYCL1PPCAC_05914 [Pristionchus mayeri]|uniref:Uncharacterized protein n=1 Tax=Pristionchus mayeri TaxID=1317129 RepID=A0AAN5CB71_9BILA|nr:hypothetical protein PMAYCL1PPCAC_05914 [Pristionchus mayeri]